MTRSPGFFLTFGYPEVIEATGSSWRLPVVFHHVGHDEVMFKKPTFTSSGPQESTSFREAPVFLGKKVRPRIISLLIITPNQLIWDLHYIWNPFTFAIFYWLEANHRSHSHSKETGILGSTLGTVPQSGRLKKCYLLEILLFYISHLLPQSRKISKCIYSLDVWQINYTGSVYPHKKI